MPAEPNQPVTELLRAAQAGDAGAAASIERDCESRRAGQSISSAASARSRAAKLAGRIAALSAPLLGNRQTDTSLKAERGKPVAYALINDLPTLLYLVNQGTLTFHPWLSRVGSLDRPDFVLFDLDPGEAPFADVATVARQLHEELLAEGRDAVVKTSGKSGLHVLVPWRERGGYDEARSWAHEVAERVVETLPKRATVDIRKAKRGERVYIDVMQNARGHHAVPPYVLRAMPGATVSTPLRWAEVTEGLDPRRFTLRTVPARIARQKADPVAVLAAGK